MKAPVKPGFFVVYFIEFDFRYSNRFKLIYIKNDFTSHLLSQAFQEHIGPSFTKKIPQSIPINWFEWGEY
jgi:hypothetical protein